MSFEHWLLYAAICTLTILSPGPAIVLALRNGISQGGWAVLVSTFGNALGLLALACLSVLGLAAIMASSSWLFQVIKLLGAVYLIWLGISQFRAGKDFFSKANTVKKTSRAYAYLFVEALGVAITNPKPILFFGAIFPQFVKVAADDVLMQYAILIATFIVISIISLMVYGLSGQGIRRFLSTAKRMCWFNRAVGGVFVSFGLGLFASTLARRQ